MDDALRPLELTVTAELIRQYAELTNDFNPIHLDAAFARGTAMGGIIAHGTMSLNLLLESLEATLEGEGGVAVEIRFQRPVRLGDVIRCGGTRAEDREVWDVWVENQNGEKVLSGTATRARNSGS